MCDGDKDLAIGDSRSSCVDHNFLRIRVKSIKSISVPGEASVADVIAELRRGSRVLLLLRHSERPKIGYEDKTFGAALPLTENGRRLCVEFGRKLAGATPSVEFRASPLLRTVMTAELVAEGMGLVGAEVVRDALIGNGSAYVASELEVWRLFRDGSFFKRMGEYMQSGEQRGFNPLAPATDAFEEHALSVFSAQLGVFATHDVYVAAYLHARGAKTDFCRENWPRFMDSAAIVVAPGGARRYALVRAGLVDRVAMDVKNAPALYGKTVGLERFDLALRKLRDPLRHEKPALPG